MSIGQDLLNVPMGDMIRDMAFAIADSQFQLDQSSMRTAEMMGGLQTVYDEEGKISFDDSRVFFGYEYMTVKQALAYAIFDDGLTGEITDDTLKLKDLILDVIATFAGNADSPVTVTRDGVEDGGKLSPQLKKFEDEIIRVPTRLSMMELGFSPTFYQFVDTIIEVKIAIKMTRESSYSRTKSNTTNNTSSNSSKGFRLSGISSLRYGLSAGRTNTNNNSVQTSQVDATYSSKYSYSAEGATLLRTKMVPIPPPAVLEDRIRQRMDVEAELLAQQIENNKPETDEE
ncbi:hypothetical protein [uncultured Psychromonas sp.]|uniref:hypothetical protein n=1 Tax=uncultured Psychromonas sp. TaxID=173974 RepID=UPI0026042C5B|nr:hypothetical protein [uncultured Psychromonas sp.]